MSGLNKPAVQPLRYFAIRRDETEFWDMNAWSQDKRPDPTGDRAELCRVMRDVHQQQQRSQ